MIVVGVDPGAGGAVAALDPDGQLIDTWDMPVDEIRGRRRVNAPRLAHIIAAAQPGVVVTEELTAVQGSGATGAYRFGEAVGIVHGVAAGLGVPLHAVRPQRWTRDLGVGSDKGAHRQAAARLWPNRADLFARTRDDGRADAALLAHWWHRQGDT